MERRWWALGLVVLVSGCAGSNTVAPEGSASTSTTGVVTTSTGAIEGIIHDPAGLPIASATIGLKKDLFEGSTNSSAEGTFALSGLSPGPYGLFAQKLGYASYASKTNVTAGGVTKVDIRLAALALGPSFPIQFDAYSVRTQGIWFQVPYAEAQKRMPPGFRAKPHVLADPNDQTAEFAVYVTSYKNGTLDNKSVPEGAWAFEVLNVDPPSPHASGATVDFVLLASYATDPAVQKLLGDWNLPTLAAGITFAPGDLAASASRATSTVKLEKGSYTLTTTNAGQTDTAAGTSLSVRLFGVVDKAVVNYVDLAVSPVMYSIQGAGTADGASNFAINPPAPAGEGYVQWGPSAHQSFMFLAAKKT